MISLRELARLSNLSVSTISRGLRDDPVVTEDTRKKIKELAERFGYKPNHLVEGIFKGRARTVAIVAADTSLEPVSGLVAKMSNRLRAAGYATIVLNSEYDPEVESDCFRMAVGHRVSGMIVSTVDYESSEAHFVNMRRDKVPFVLIAEYASRVSAPHLHGDDGAGGRAVAQHLLELGHRRFAHLAGPGTTLAQSLRFAGYQARLAEADIALPASAIKATDWTFASGFVAMQELLAKNPRPTAVFAATDLLAAAALRAAREAGLVVPRDLSVVGMGDIMMSELLSPSLTTVARDQDLLANQAVDTLLKLIAAEPGQPVPKDLMESVVSCRLIVRESTGPAPGQ